MRLTLHWILTPALVSLALGASEDPVSAQSSRLSITGAVGPTYIGTTSEYRGKDMAAVGDVLLTYVLTSGKAVAGVSVNGTGPGAYEACETAPALGCHPVLPEFLVFLGHVGWQTPGGALRLLGGAGAARHEDGGTALALQARADGAVTVWRPIALVGSLRALSVPGHEGESFLWVGPAVGLRITLF